MKDTGLKSIPFKRLRDGIFSIVFFLKEEMEQFLHLDNSNRLLAAVKH